MNRLAVVSKIRVPKQVFEQTIANLRIAGLKGYECFALWFGIQNGIEFNVKEVCIPRQTGHKTPEGVCVIVDSDELHRLNVYLYEKHLSLLVQIHTHPTEAYHSGTDDLYPIATQVGSLSLVIPDFAAYGHNVATWAMYRLSSDAKWDEIHDAEKQNLLEIY